MATQLDRPPVNPRMLIWARERCGKTLDEVSTKFPKIDSWEANKSKPTVKQARALAEFYRRSFLEFFRSEPPVIDEPAAIPDFRMERGITSPSESFALREAQGWAEANRLNALDLLTELNEPIPEIPSTIFATMDDDVESAARKVRAALHFDIGEQTALSSGERDKLPDIIRHKIERLGILVFKNPSIKAFKARGICIAEFPLPVIVYANESPGAQAFTIAHELGHILLKQSGVIGYVERAHPKAIEVWCNKFAGSFLMPGIHIRRVLGDPPPKPASAMDDSVLGELATHFRVSPHAMLIRLVHLGYVSASYYWDVKKPQFDQEEATYKPFGIPKYYGSRYKNSLGDFYTGLVIEAWNAGRITNHNAAEYMGIKNLSHLYDIRANFR